MEQIRLTNDHKEVIKQYLNGEISNFSATPYQQKYLGEVLRMATDRLMQYHEDYDSGDDLVKWFWNEYLEQESNGKE